VKKGMMMGSLKKVVLVFSLLLVAANCTLYGYYSTNESSALVSIDPQSGASESVCDLSSLARLGSAPSSAYTTGGLLLFYTITDNGKNISLVQLDPTTCNTKTMAITGLMKGQNDVRDIKYDSLNEVLYMVFPDPDCLHGSLDSINVQTGAVINHIADVVDPPGFGQMSALDPVNNEFYYVGIPFEETIQYQLFTVFLKSGNISTLTMPSNPLDIGNNWAANYTLSVVDTGSGPTVFGAVSPSNSSLKECYPSGFYTLNPSTGVSSCASDPIQYEVYPLAEFDSSTLYYYQLFTDSEDNFYLVTYDTQSQTILSTTPCKMCSMISALAAL